MIDEAYQRFLKERTQADTMGHSGRTLYTHLCGTHDLLQAWGNRKPVCDAGLFHSIYGTQSFRRKAWPIADRDTIRELIGAEAELLAYMFCVADRRTFVDGDFAGATDLREIETANLIEQGSTSKRLERLLGTDISSGAKRAIEAHGAKRKEVA